MTISKDMSSQVELHFRLHVIDEWPPVAVEGVLCTLVENGYRIESPPLFVKGISVEDIIEVKFDTENYVAWWQPISKSGRTTAWIMRTGPDNNIQTIVAELRLLGCQIEQLPELGCYAVDIPAEVSITDIDARFARLNEDSTAVAFPSYRHT